MSWKRASIYIIMHNICKHWFPLRKCEEANENMARIIHENEKISAIWPTVSKLKRDFLVVFDNVNNVATKDYMYM